MLAHLSVETGLVHDYGVACATHAADLDAAAACLRGVGAGAAAAFGPVGAQFLASLTRAAAAQSASLGRLSTSVDAGRAAATSCAQAYDLSDGDAASRLAGSI